jgi:hypothetical protein
VSAFCSMFSQLLKLFPRTEFQAVASGSWGDQRLSMERYVMLLGPPDGAATARGR